MISVIIVFRGRCNRGAIAEKWIKSASRGAVAEFSIFAEILQNYYVFNLRIAKKFKPNRADDVGVRSLSPEIGLGLAYSLFRVQTA